VRQKWAAGAKSRVLMAQNAQFLKLSSGDASCTDHLRVIDFRHGQEKTVTPKKSYKQKRKKVRTREKTVQESNGT
jgi:hypothetical protein